MPIQPHGTYLLKCLKCHREPEQEAMVTIKKSFSLVANTTRYQINAIHLKLAQGYMSIITQAGGKKQRKQAFFPSSNQ